MRKYLLLILIFNIINVYSQNSFESNLSGLWKLKLFLKSNDTEINFTDYIIFKNNEMHFLKKQSKSKKLLFVKKIELEKDEEGEIQVTFENKEIWQLSFRNINNETRLIWKQTVAKNGDHLGQIDDRWALIDKAERKKALDSEINTYYVKVK